MGENGRTLCVGGQCQAVSSQALRSRGRGPGGRGGVELADMPRYPVGRLPSSTSDFLLYTRSTLFVRALSILARVVCCGDQGNAGDPSRPPGVSFA